MRISVLMVMIVFASFAVRCGSTADQGTPSPSVSKEEPEKCSPGGIVNYYVVIDRVSGDGFSGPVATSDGGPLEKDSVTVGVTSSTKWNGAIQALTDLRVGMSWIQAVGPLQDDCSIVAVNIFSPGGAVPTPIPGYTPGALLPCPLGENGPGQFANASLAVEDVSDDSFTASFGSWDGPNPKSATVQVTPLTRWNGNIRGLADLKPGTKWLQVIGTRLGGWDDCIMLAENIVLQQTSSPEPTAGMPATAHP